MDIRNYGISRNGLGSIAGIKGQDSMTAPSLLQQMGVGGLGDMSSISEEAQEEDGIGSNLNICNMLGSSPTSQAKALLEQIEKLESENTQLSSKDTELATEESTKTETLKQAEAELEELKQLPPDSSDDPNAVYCKAPERDNKICLKEAQISFLKKRLEEIQEERKQIQQQIQENKQKISELKEQVKSLMDEDDNSGNNQFPIPNPGIFDIPEGGLGKHRRDATDPSIPIPATTTVQGGQSTKDIDPGFSKTVPEGTYKDIDPGFSKTVPEGTYKDIDPGFSKTIPEGSHKDIDLGPSKTIPEGSHKDIDPGFSKTVPEGTYRDIDPGFSKTVPEGTYKDIDPGFSKTI